MTKNNSNNELKLIKKEFEIFMGKYKNLSVEQEKLAQDYLSKVDEIMAQRIIKKIQK